MFATLSFNFKSVTKSFILSVLGCCMFLKPSYSQGVWAPLGGSAGLVANNIVQALCYDPSGNVYAVGDFSNDSSKRYVAKYDGTQWTELGGHNSLKANQQLLTVAADKAGNIYTAGSMTNSLGQCYVAKWDGTQWTELGGPNSLMTNGGFVFTITTDKYNNVYAGGSIKNATGQYYIAKWDGTQWTEVGGPGVYPGFFTGYTRAMCADTFGNVFAGGDFSNANSYHFVAKWDGTAWSELGGTNSLGQIDYWQIILALTCDRTGNVYVGGELRTTSLKRYVKKFDGTSWSQLNGAIPLNANNMILSLATDNYNGVYACGNFTDAANDTYVAYWNDTLWKKLGNATPSGSNGSMSAVIFNPYTAKVCVGGGFPNSFGHLTVYSFQTNVPVLTTVSDVPVNQTYTESIAAPNPFSQKTVINLEKINQGEGIDFRLYNSIGAICKTLSIAGTSQIEINKENLTPGLYFFEAYQAAGKIGHGRLMVVE